MSAATIDQVLEELKKLTGRVARVEERVNTLDNIGSTVNEHDDRLDEHGRQLESLSTSIGEIRTSMHAMGSNVARLMETRTADHLILQRFEKHLTIDRANQEKRDVAINGALERLIELSQPKAVL